MIPNNGVGINFPTPILYGAEHKFAGGTADSVVSFGTNGRDGGICKIRLFQLYTIIVNRG
nr:MAG TPA: hypothetical protein [Caudoviricetes sp.]